jgi:hypothetical protein
MLPERCLDVVDVGRCGCWRNLTPLHCCFTSACAPSAPPFLHLAPLLAPLAIHSFIHSVSLHSFPLTATIGPNVPIQPQRPLKSINNQNECWMELDGCMDAMSACCAMNAVLRVRSQESEGRTSPHVSNRTRVDSASISPGLGQTPACCTASVRE